LYSDFLSGDRHTLQENTAPEGTVCRFTTNGAVGTTRDHAGIAWNQAGIQAGMNDQV